MHDLDRTQLESEFQFGEGESFEFGNEGENEVYGEYSEGVFSEAEEMELASEFLGITSEAELDQFLGKMIRAAGRTLGKFVRSPIGRALGRALKGVAKVALPVAGKALGTFVGGPVGGMIGGKLASAAGSAFGLELEGLSQEDREFEIARSFVRLAGDAARTAAQASPAADPVQAAQQALAAAAKKYAPGLLQGAYGAVRGRGGRSGRWVRRGGVIVLFGA